MNGNIVYGYQIRNGELTVHTQKAEHVKQIFSLYLNGMAMQKIADTLNSNDNTHSPEHPIWTHNRIRKILLNPCYAGSSGYPPLIDDDLFHMAQVMRMERAPKWGDHPALCLVKKLRCGNCGHKLRRSVQRQWRNTLRFLCDECGARITIPDADLLAEVERQAADYTPPSDSAGYTPSEDTIRLTNAINRGLEKPDRPEEVAALIMQGISARYDCFPTQMTSNDLLRLIREKDFDQAIQYITISAENAVTVAFK